MAKFRKSQKAKTGRFYLGMLIYAVVFLVIAAIGLGVFWKFIEAYELSRAKNTLDQYIAQLTVEDMAASAQDSIAQVDAKIQSEEDCVDVIRNAVTEKLSYAKKSKESSETRQVYAIRSAKQPIGQIAITAGEADMFGFTRWTVTEESYDFSYLMQEPVSITVPEHFQVSMNGNVLDDSYITQKDIPYEALESFQGQFPMAAMVTYTAENVMGELALKVLDENGGEVEITEQTDMNAFIPRCSEEEKAQLDALMEPFLTRYIAFTGSANKSIERNYRNLIAYMVPDGALAQRLRTAFEGLTFAQSSSDKITQITIHDYYRLSDERFICDVTYQLETVGRKGKVESTNNMKIVFLKMEEDLKVEAMTSY